MTAANDNLAPNEGGSKRTEARCPICSKPALQKWAPFCSKRCADVDLHRWLGGHYAIPSEAVDEDNEEGSE